MRKGILILFFLGFSKLTMAQNEIGPEGEKLLWVFIILLVFPVVYLLVSRRKNKHKTKTARPLFNRENVRVSLEKDALYYPDYLKLTVKNTGNTDIDLDRPLLVFDNFWLKRKFRLKGMENRNFYPLYLEKGKTHSLNIDLARFYRHDKSLKRFPKVKLLVTNVKGKKLGSRSVFLRKTLFKF